MKKQKLQALVQQIKGKLTAVASDESLDRHGDVIKQGDWDLRNFRKNPVMLFGHRHDLPPVGLVKNIRIKDGVMTFEPHFHEFTDLARDLKRLYDEGVMKAFSVGFIPGALRGGDEKDAKSKNELLEISAVSIGANANALIQNSKSVAAAAAGEELECDDATCKAITDWVNKSDEEEDLEIPTDEDVNDEDIDFEGKMAILKSVQEVQVLIISKDVFDDEDAAIAWLNEHNFKSDDMTEIEDAWRFKQFEEELCEPKSFKTFELARGIKAGICSLKEEKAADTTNITNKEGRVLSGKNRKLIGDAVSALTALLEATERSSDSDKGIKDTKQGRDLQGNEASKARILKQALKQANTITRKALEQSK